MKPLYINKQKWFVPLSFSLSLSPLSLTLPSISFYSPLLLSALYLVKYSNINGHNVSLHQWPVVRNTMRRHLIHRCTYLWWCTSIIYLFKTNKKKEEKTRGEGGGLRYWFWKLVIIEWRWVGSWVNDCIVYFCINLFSCHSRLKYKWEVIYRGS